MDRRLQCVWASHGPLTFQLRELDQVAYRGNTTLATGVFNANDTDPGAVVEAEHEVALKVVSSEHERIVRRRADISTRTGPIDVTEAPDFHKNWAEVLRRQEEEDEEEERQKVVT